MSTKIVRRRLAGDAHAVITVEGGGHRYRRRVCKTCPWRVDAIGEFPAEAFRHSATTATDGAHFLSVGEEATQPFGCHQSGADKPAVCAGYILRGSGAIGWRLAVALGKFDPSRVASDVPLFGSYYEMAVANGVDPAHPALAVCRGDDRG